MMISQQFLLLALPTTDDTCEPVMFSTAQCEQHYIELNELGGYSDEILINLRLVILIAKLKLDLLAVHADINPERRFQVTNESK